MNNMWKWSFGLVTIVITSSVAALGIMSLMSRRGKPQGMVHGRLTPCPQQPNCVCSEFDDTSRNQFPPIPYSCTPDMAFETIKKVVVAENGSVTQTEGGNYLAATFQSSIFRFVDDVEFRISPSESVIHIRSASRVGYSDRGANLRRAKAIATQFKVASTPRSH